MLGEDFARLAYADKQWLNVFATIPCLCFMLI
ncbi:hypothetical protein SAMN05414139_07305 [Burkholderia sp. D7]|nr:hypothetical protein SAMN05414139_07305 [Burkholderia sp. D7]